MKPGRDPRFDTLFDEVRIGPVTAPNRFYQVPHCTGMGFGSPNTLAAMREMKAEGGWGVVCTEYCSIHPSSDDSPMPYASLWDEDDVRAHASMVDRVHRHGSLAGVRIETNHALTRLRPDGAELSCSFTGRDGHRYARAFGEDPDVQVSFRRERPIID